MIRGIRGATTVTENDANQIIDRSIELMKEIIDTNKINPGEVTSVYFTTTEDLTAAFPAKSLRYLDGWTYVPVMCMREIPVPESLPMCIRVMVTAATEREQHEINHVYHYEAQQLRPDLQQKGE